MTETGQATAVRMPLVNKILFASDHIGLQTISYFRQVWILFFLAPPADEGIARVPEVSLLGLNVNAGVFAGFLIFAGRIVDAFTDPLIAWWSDRTYSHWGRRLPFILFSTPLYALFAALIWFLPDENASLRNAIYLAIALELFFTANTMSSNPLEALVPEVTRGASDRMNLVGLIFVLAIVGTVLGLVVGSSLVDAFGFKVVGVIFAVVGIIFRYISLSAVWKYAPRHTPPATVGFWRGVRETLRNRQFAYYLPTFVMFTSGVGMLLGWAPYFASGLLEAEEDDVGGIVGLLTGVVILGVMVSGITFWSLHNRFGLSKRGIYGTCLVACGVTFPLLGLVGLIYDSSLFLQALILAFIAGVSQSAAFMLPKGLTADIADYDAMLTGERREAMFYATSSFFEKISFAIPPALLALVLLLGDSTEDPLGIRLAPVLAGALTLSGIVLWHRYRLPNTVDRESVEAAGLLPSRAVQGLAD